jgi:DNA-binding transcriptional MocR family regulator
VIAQIQNLDMSAVNQYIATMTIYLPILRDSSASKADRIATAIAADIKSGTLKLREKLPTHRDLASRLGVTPGTISRAYALLERQGLLIGEVGRGTFVADPHGPLGDLLVSGPDQTEARPIDLAVNRRAAPWVQTALSQTLQALDRERAWGMLMDYQPESGLDRHRSALASWLGQQAFEVDPDRLILTAGAQHAVFLVFSVLASRGDVVLVEDFTYAGFKALADELGLRLEPVRMDADGVDPDDLERCAKATGAKWFYTMPQVHNPTGAVLSHGRRREVLRVARKQDFRIVEDGVYDFLSSDRVAPLAAMDEERIFYVTSFSKSLAPGLRAGCLVSPTEWVDRIARAVRRSMWMIPALGVELCARWIADGELDRLLVKQREELSRRAETLKTALKEAAIVTPPGAAFAWVRLPPEVTSSTVVAHSRELGIKLAPTEAFAVRRGLAGQFLRLNLSACDTSEELGKALRLIAPLLSGESMARAYY